MNGSWDTLEKMTKEQFATVQLDKVQRHSLRTDKNRIRWFVIAAPVDGRGEDLIFFKYLRSSPCNVQ